MKKIAFFAAAALMLCLTACSNDKEGFDDTDDDDGDGQELPVESYRGTLIVDQNDGTVYIQKNVLVQVAVEEGEAVVQMMKVKFSDRMPIELSMTINGITAKEKSGGFDLSGDGLVPYALGGDFEEYTITKMQGELSGKRIDFEMMCGQYPLVFSGIHENEIAESEISYTGTLHVKQDNGDVYTQEDVVIQVSIDFAADRADILMKQVSFSDRMPLKLDMTIPGLSAPASYGGYTLSGDDIIPNALGGQYPLYTITGFTGTISELIEGGIQFEMMCGQYPTSFSGIKNGK